MRLKALRVAAVAAVGVLAAVASVEAQNLGTFRWRVAPFCNVLTLTIVQERQAFMLAGWDDGCGDPQRWGTYGVAFGNPDGTTAGMSLTTVAPGGVVLHTYVTLDPATLSGTWEDDSVPPQSGTFIFLGP